MLLMQVGYASMLPTANAQDEEVVVLGKENPALLRGKFQLVDVGGAESSRLPSC